MRVIKVLYDFDTDFICKIVDELKGNNIVESYNMNFHKDVKKARPIQTRFGTTKLPLIVFEDENLEEVGAIWPESNPDWVVSIKKQLE